VPELFEHQREGVAWLRDRPHAALYDEPGLGKSLQVIREAVEPVLISAPAMVLDSGTWDDEIERWADGIEATQVAYTSLSGREKTKRGGNRPTGELKPELQRRWGTKIADESHHLSRSAHWSKIFESIEAGQTRLSTGTPINNWAHEAFPQLRLIHPEEAKTGRDYGSYWRWAREWFHVGPTYNRAGQQMAPMAVGEFKDAAHVATCPECEDPRTWEEFREANWGERMLLRLRENCLDLPPLVQTEWKVHMKGPQAKAYRELKKDFVTWLDSGAEVAAWNEAAQTVKLAKAATGLEILDPSVKGSAKLDALRVILEDRPRPTLVVAYFQLSVEACARAAAEVGAEARFLHGGSSRKDRRELSRAFKSGDLPVLCASIDLISEGMTFVKADQIVRVERSARPSRNEQVELRLHRIGQERPVQVIDLVTVGTWDQRILGLLATKTDQQIKALGKEELRALVA